MEVLGAISRIPWRWPGYKAMNCSRRMSEAYQAQRPCPVLLSPSFVAQDASPCNKRKSGSANKSREVLLVHRGLWVTWIISFYTDWTIDKRSRTSPTNLAVCLWWESILSKEFRIIFRHPYELPTSCEIYEKFIPVYCATYVFCVLKVSIAHEMRQ